MNVVSIGTDTSVCDAASATARRVTGYAAHTDGWHAIVFSRGKNLPEEIRHAEKTFVYPTRSLAKVFAPFGAYRLGAKIIRELKWRTPASDIRILTQDPFESGIVGWALAKRFRASLVVQAHTDLAARGFWRGSAFNFVRLALARLTLPAALGVRVVSERVKRGIVAKYAVAPETISVLPVFVDTRAIAARAEDARREPAPEWRTRFQKVVLTVSRLEREKNIALGIRAFARVLEKFPGAGLVIVGDGRDRAGLERFARRLGLAGRVVFAGWQKDAAPYFAHADAYLLTSRYEGHGMTLAEAAAAGCPIVSTDVGLVGETLANGEHLLACPTDGEECLARNLLEALGNQREAVARAARARRAALSRTPATFDDYARAFVRILAEAGTATNR